MDLRDQFDFPLGDLCFAWEGKAIEPGGSVELCDPTGAPYGEPDSYARCFNVRPVRFGLLPDPVKDWALNSVKVMGVEQFVGAIQPGGVPLAVFADANGHPDDLIFPTQTIGGRISITVTNISDSPKEFRCTMIGKFAIAKGTLSPRGQEELEAQRAGGWLH